MPRRVDVAWAAGFFDGEGCVTRSGRNRSVLRVQVTQKRIEPLLRFMDVVGAGTIQKPRGNGVMDWTVAGLKARKVLLLLWPYLSEPKREQAEIVIGSF